MFAREQNKNNNLVNELHTLLRANFTCEQWQKFDEQKRDKYRIKTLLDMKKPEIETWINKKAKLHSFCKDKSKALALKDSGNKAFGTGKYHSALQIYSESLKWMPVDGSSDAAVVYANRSACLFHLKEYTLALQDAEIAFKLNYPKELHYKLYERSGRCCFHEGNIEEAAKLIKLSIKSIDNSTVVLEECKRAKLKSDLESFLKIITSNSSNVKGKNNESDIDKLILPELVGGRGKYLHNASHHCQLLRNDIEGRFISATKDIHPGDVVFVDKAYVSALSPEFYHKHCSFCFAQIRVPIACSNCVIISYCSPKCQDAAWNTHHRFECEILPFLANSKMSITCYLALRTLTQANPLEVINWYNLANSTEELNNNNDEMQNDYNSNSKSPERSELTDDNVYRSDHHALFNHVTHSEDRNTQENFQQAIIALYLLFAIKLTNYFKEIQEKILSEMTIEDGMEMTCRKNAEELTELQLGTLIFRFLNFLQFNTHEISTWDCEKKESVYIGAGLFNTLTLSNHSCVPTLTRYFINDTVVVRAIRTIRKGEQVTDNYGPVYSTTSSEERHLTLLNAFWFECRCAACKSDWPVFEKMSEEYTFQCGFCHQDLLPSNNETLSFFIRCPNCSQMTNTLQVIKCLQELETKYTQASTLMMEEHVENALAIALDSISRLDNLIVIPCRLHQIFQDTIKTGFQKLGNKSLHLPLICSNGNVI